MTEFTQVSNISGFANLTGRDLKGLAQGETALSPFLQIIENMVAGMEEDEKANLLGGDLLLELEKGILTKVDTDDGQSDEEDEEVINNIMENIGFMHSPMPLNVKQVSLEELQLVKNSNEAMVDTEKVSTLDVNILSSTNEKSLEENVQIAPHIQDEKLTAIKIEELTKQESFVAAQQLDGTKDKKNIEKSQSVENTLPKMSLNSNEDDVIETKTNIPWSKEVLKTEQEFAATVDKVKAQLKDETKLDEKPDTKQGVVTTLNSEPSFEKIELSSGKIIAQKMETQIDNPKLAQQIKTEISSHLTKGDKEFTMKLKPEELGEITIKMVKSGEKVTVDIMAVNPKTVQLLNGDLGTLREILKPMQAEVRPVVSAEASDGFKQMQEFNMSGQSFANQQNQWRQRESQPNYYGDLTYLEDESVSKTTITSNGPKLKMYI